MPASVQIVLGRYGIGLLNKLRYLESVAVQRRAFLYVAKTGFSPGRPDAERHQPALVGQSPCAVDGSGKGRHIGDQVVGRQHQQLRILTVASGHVQSGGGNGRGGVASCRFKDEVQRYAAIVERAIVIKGAEKYLATGHRQQAVYVCQADCTLEGFLQQALAVGQAHEGLGHGLT